MLVAEGAGVTVMSRSTRTAHLGLASVMIVCACGGDGQSSVDAGTDATPFGSQPGGSLAGNGGRPSTPGGAGGGPGETPDAGVEMDVAAGPTYSGPRVLIIVLEGLRPEDVTLEDMPYLSALATRGVRYRTMHSVFPAAAPVVAASLATGRWPSGHGVQGNRLYLPGVEGKDAAGRTFKSTVPFDLSDYAVIAAAGAKLGGGLPKGGPTLFAAAEAAGAITAIYGRSGPVSLLGSDLGRDLFMDEDVLVPEQAADELARGYRLAGLPRHTGVLYSKFAGTPSPFVPPVIRPMRTLPPGLDPVLLTRTPPKVQVSAARSAELSGDIGAGSIDPSTVMSDSAFGASNRMFVALFKYLHIASGLPTRDAQLLLFWLREPGHGASVFGPGTLSQRSAARHTDQVLGQIIPSFDETVNVVVVSTGGVSTVAGDAETFARHPLTAHGFTATLVTAPDPMTGQLYTATRYQADTHGLAPMKIPDGIAVDGEVRLAWLLRNAGFTGAYDADGVSIAGNRSGCLTAAMANQQKDKAKLLAGKICLPSGSDKAAKPDPETIFVASNGGTELLYLPRGTQAFAERVVSFLQARPEVGPIFVSSRFSVIPGTLPLGDARFEVPQREGQPDIVLSYAWRADDVANRLISLSIAPPPPVEQRRWWESCSTATQDCRPGLWCGRSRETPAATSELAQDRCLYCPSVPDDPKKTPAENLFVEQTQETCRFVESVFEPTWAPGAAERAKLTAPVPKGQRCEYRGLCTAGLACIPIGTPNLPNEGVCLEPGSALPLLPFEPPVEVVSLPFAIPMKAGAFPGTAFASMRNQRGVMGGFAPAEMGAVLIAVGPAFRTGGLEITTPAGLVDVAPTVARIMGLDLPAADGRPLLEALAGADVPVPEVEERTRRSSPTEPLRLYDPRDSNSTMATTLPKPVTFATELVERVVKADGKEYRYLVSARAVRTEVP